MKMTGPVMGQKGMAPYIYIDVPGPAKANLVCDHSLTTLYWYFIGQSMNQ